MIHNGNLCLKFLYFYLLGYLNTFVYLAKI